MERSRHLLLLAAPLLTSALKVKLGGLAPPPPAKTHFDLIVIGGGSGGLAASKAAANLGKSVAVFDFVKPSPQGTTWGLGGTCVNVGCIPKKLMHQAAQLGEARADSAYYGWEIAEEEHDWETMVAGVQNYVKSMNFAYRTQCMTNDVTYIDAFATFVDTHKLEATTKAGATTEYTADQFVVCTGGRPPVQTTNWSAVYSVVAPALVVASSLCVSTNVANASMYVTSLVMHCVRYAKFIDLT